MHKDGIIVVDKPEGLTSHDVVLQVRRRIGIKKVGHAGTLDPIASGVLIMLVGRATKMFNKFSDMDKAYSATLTFGKATDTGDIEGKVIKEMPFSHVDEAGVNAVFKQFIGEIDQVPPMMSALKHKGKRLYELARKGLTVPIPARKIRIYSIDLTKFSLPDVDFTLCCSKGTYVRKFAEDAAEKLGTCACISRIRRVSIGDFLIENAVQLEDVTSEKVIGFGSLRF